MKKKVYRFEWACGRQGDLDGLFVSDDKSIKEAIGNTVYFGEVLGKHSDVSGTLDEDDIKKLSSNKEVVEFVEKYGPFGFNPLNYIQIDCELCGETLVEYGEDYSEDVVKNCTEPCGECPQKNGAVAE